jgi:hypothetical protein
VPFAAPAILAGVAIAAAWHCRHLRRDIPAELAPGREANGALDERLARSARMVEETQRLGHLRTREWGAEND